jgi:ribonuclease G
LRDIGGIIVIDFIDMANPKNRGQVEEALRSELERDRTKTYVVEISPLGLVEMTRQNVTEGPREVMTRKCPTCGGDGIVLSEATAAIEVERRLRGLARGSRVQAFLVEVNPKVASLLMGPGGSRLEAIEASTRRRFFLVPKAGIHLDHFHVLKQGKLETIAPQAPIEEGTEVELQLVEVGLHDPQAAVAKLDGYDICVAGASKLVGKKVKARIGRVQPGTAYATLLDGVGPIGGAITAESEAEKPTRAKKAAAAKPPAAKPPAAKAPAAKPPAKAAAKKAPEPKPVAAKAAASTTEDDGGEAEAPKKKTRRGSRGGRNRRKKTAAAAPQQNGAPTIHVPPADLGQAADEPPAEAVPAEADAASENGAEPAKPRKKTRRGSRGGRNRRKKPAAATAEASSPEPADNG